MGGIGGPEILVILVIVFSRLLPLAAVVALGIAAKRGFDRLGAMEARLAALESAALAARKDIG
ncbi:MAG: hypothetical protein ABI780_08930 [Ardenticatenales bacterium]